MADYPIEDADPVAAVLAGLAADPRIVGPSGAFGADPAAVSGLREAPWPHLRVAAGTGSGDYGSLRYDLTDEVNLEVFGDPDGSTSEADVWRLTVLAARVALGLPERDAVPGEPVVLRVGTSGSVAVQDLANGQRKQRIGLTVTVRPG